MDNNNNKSGNNFLSGFLLGALVGAGIVFLLGTEKGKKLLKVISEEGLENVSKVVEKVEKKVNLDKVLEDEEDFASDEELAPKERSIAEVKPKVKRFFRGISRHAN